MHLSVPPPPSWFSASNFLPLHLQKRSSRMSPLLERTLGPLVLASTCNPPNASRTPTSRPSPAVGSLVFCLPGSPLVGNIRKRVLTSTSILLHRVPGDLRSWPSMLQATLALCYLLTPRLGPESHLLGLGSLLAYSDLLTPGPHLDGLSGTSPGHCLFV